MEPTAKGRVLAGIRPPASAKVHLDGEYLGRECPGQGLALALWMSFDAAAQVPHSVPFAFDDYVEPAQPA